MSFQVLGHIQNQIGQRMVSFEIVDILITTRRLPYNSYGATKDKHTIYISLNGVSEIQFVSTLVHELAHVLTFSVGHNSIWLKTCGYLMGLINKINTFRDMEGFQLCASTAGVNVLPLSDVTDAF